MKSLLTYILLFLAFGLAKAQQYEPLHANGRIPIDFTLSPITKYENQTESISERARRSGRETEELFYMESCFVIDDLLKSGKILFNDPVSLYVNQVADSLLATEPLLRKQLRFYVVRSCSVNAFATHSGIIFINLGLLARLENEAQLAFVLAHEIIHFKEKHALNIFAEKARVLQGVEQSSAFEQNLFSKQQFSKQLEIEADEKGLALFNQSNYSLNSIDRLFDILALAHVHYNNKTFKRSFFETPYLQFPNRLFLAKTNPILFLNHENENSSHPGLTKRKNIIQSEIQKLDALNDKHDFLIPSPLFYSLRQKARYELPYLYLNENKFYDAIYSAYLLIEEGEKSIYLEKCVLKGLQGLTYHRNAKETRKVVVDHIFIQGEIQQLHFFLNELRDDQLNILSVSYAWYLHKEYPDDNELSLLFEGLTQELMNHHYNDIDDFKTVPPKTGSASVEKNEPTNTLSDWETEFARYAFVECIKEPKFTLVMNACKKQKYLTLQQKSFEQRKSNSSKKYQSRNKQTLGVSNVIIVNPHYMKYNVKKANDEQKLFLETEEARKGFRKKLWENAGLVNLNIDILDMKSLNSTDTKKYNDITVLSEWLEQQLGFESFDMPSFNQGEVNEIAQKYGTDYFMWIGVINKREKKDFISSLAHFFSPQDRSSSFCSPKYESLFYAVVYDVRNYDLKMLNISLIKQNDNDDIISAHIYEALLNIKTEKTEN